MRSMTGFASAEGFTETSDGPVGWRWDARSVNHRGLDLKLRLPPGFETREAGWRRAAGQAFARGSVSLSLSLTETASAGAPRLDPEALTAALDAASEAAAAAAARGVATAPLALDGLLRLPGVFGARAMDPAEERPEALVADVDAAFATLLEKLGGARQDEGDALAGVLNGHVATLRALRSQAAERAAARSAVAAERLKTKVAELLAAGATAQPGVDEPRLAQELALLAVKADVQEELDRLAAHLDSAEALMAETAPIGRRFEFLAQELHREANTLCAKSQDAALTETGLAMKVAIDQLKEQTANVE